MFRLDSPVVARAILIAIVASAFVPACAAAQHARFPKPGSRVRFTAADDPGTRITGTLRVVFGDSIVVEPDRGAPPMALARADLADMEVRVGEAQAGRVATAFAVAGALSGGAVYVNWCRQNPADCQRDAWGDGSYCNCDQDDSHFAVPTLLILGGGALGWLIGYSLAMPHWEPVAGPPPMRIGVAPLGTRGIVVGAQFSVGQFARRR